MIKDTDGNDREWNAPMDLTALLQVKIEQTVIEQSASSDWAIINAMLLSNSKFSGEEILNHYEKWMVIHIFIT